jgi:hypothetical protein
MLFSFALDDKVRKQTAGNVFIALLLDLIRFKCSARIADLKVKISGFAGDKYRRE